MYHQKSAYIYELCNLERITHYHGLLTLPGNPLSRLAIALRETSVPPPTAWLIRDQALGNRFLYLVRRILSTWATDLLKKTKRRDLKIAMQIDHQRESP